MAVPELGQIRIIPDMLGYHISLSHADVTTSYGPPVTPFENIFDHRKASLCTWATDATGTDFNILSSGYETGYIMCIIDGHNLRSMDGKVLFENSTGAGVTSNVEVLMGASESGGYITPTYDTFFAFQTTTIMSMKGIALYDISTWDGDASIGILHLGVIYEMPSNTTASLSYNTKFQNKVNTAFSGASYSTLYNNNPQRVLSASWEYVTWDGVDGFTFMMQQCYGSHIPVAIQFSQDGSITEDYFMFARITKWNQTQMSPTLWKISATFEELI